MRTFLFVSIVLAACGTAVGQQNLDLAQMHNWTIVVAKDAIPSEQYAAEEFQGLFRQAAGLDLPIQNAAPKSTGNIFIGPGAGLAASPVALQVDDLGEEGLRIRIQADNIAIAGGRPRGTLYGVYEFMEKYLGIRFLTFDHTYIPQKTSWSIPCEDYQYIPPFSFRWSYYKENADHPEFAAKLRVNTTTTDEKIGGITRQSLINHSLYRLLPVEQFGKDHPEYFALVDGKRVLEIGGGGPEVCVTNPEVIEIVAQNVIKELDQNPGQKNISVSQNDNDAYCRCERCEEINRREGTPMGSHLAFVNAVAERVEKKYPDVKIGTLAYWYTRKAPKTIKPRKNVQIQLCSIECCTLHPINDPDCSRNREFCKDMEDWGKICDDIWVWNYNTNFRCYDLPFPNLRSIGPNVQYFLQNHVKGLFMQANGNGNTGEMCDLRNYVISRCIWDPSRNSWDLVQEFCRLHYADAAQPIMDYLTMLHDNAEACGMHPGCFPSTAEVGLTPEISLKSLAYFDRALHSTKDNAVRARVEKASICAHKAVLETCATLEYKDGEYIVGLPKPQRHVIDRYIDLCKRYNMSMAAETRPAADYFKEITEAVGRRYAAQRIENPVWQLTIIPEDSGKIVEMIHKPSGRNMLAPREGGGRLGDPFWIGTIREVRLTGDGWKSPGPFHAVADANGLQLTCDFPDGSVLVRRIGFRADEPEKIRFETFVIQEGAEPQGYQFKLIPHFCTFTRSEDSAVFTAYVKTDKWMPFNKDWQGNKGPLEDLLQKGTGECALFNHEAKCGILLKYRPEQFVKAGLWWAPPCQQANLELTTKPVELKTGQVLTFGYSCEYLDKAPM